MYKLLEIKIIIVSNREQNDFSNGNKYSISIMMIYVII